MTSKQVTAQAVAALYTASGRNADRAELNLYHAALAEETDEDVREAVVLIVRGVDLGERPPSPGLIIETVRGIQRRRALENANRSALSEHSGPPVDAETGLEHIRSLREALRARKDPAA